MEKIWYEDLPNFITFDNYFMIWPDKEMKFAEQLNCLLRFSLYFTVIVFIIKKDANILFIPIFMAIFTYYVYFVDKQNKQNEKLYMDTFHVQKDKKTGKQCQKPTPNNPFMNVLVSDYATNPKRKSACSLTPTVKKEIKTYFDNNLFRDVDDVFHKNSSDRQFYTTPITTIPNDQTGFAKWLYGTGPTCKEGNGTMCYKNISRGMMN